MIVSNELLVYNILIPWRKWVSTASIIKSIKRFPSMTASARIAVFKEDGTFDIVQPQTGQLLCNSGLPDTGSISSIAYDRGCVVSDGKLVSTGSVSERMLMLLDNEMLCELSETMQGFAFHGRTDVKSKLMTVVYIPSQKRTAFCFFTKRGDLCLCDYHDYSLIKRTSPGEGIPLFLFYHVASESLVVVYPEKIALISLDNFQVIDQEIVEKVTLADFNDDLLILASENNRVRIRRIADGKFHEVETVDEDSRITCVTTQYGCFAYANEARNVRFGRSIDESAVLESPYPVYALGFLNSDLDLLIALDRDVMVMNRRKFYPFISPNTEIEVDNDNPNKEAFTKIVAQQSLTVSESNSVWRNKKPFDEEKMKGARAKFQRLKQKMAEQKRKQEQTKVATEEKQGEPVKESPDLKEMMEMTMREAGTVKMEPQTFQEEEEETEEDASGEEDDLVEESNNNDVDEEVQNIETGKNKQGNKNKKNAKKVTIEGHFEVVDVVKPYKEDLEKPESPSSKPKKRKKQVKQSQETGTSQVEYSDTEEDAMESSPTREPKLKKKQKKQTDKKEPKTETQENEATVESQIPPSKPNDPHETKESESKPSTQPQSDLTVNEQTPTATDSQSNEDEKEEESVEEEDAVSPAANPPREKPRRDTDDDWGPHEEAETYEFEPVKFKHSLNPQRPEKKEPVPPEPEPKKKKRPRKRSIVRRKKSTGEKDVTTPSEPQISLQEPLEKAQDNPVSPRNKIMRNRNPRTIGKSVTQPRTAPQQKQATGNEGEHNTTIYDQKANAQSATHEVDVGNTSPRRRLKLGNEMANGEPSHGIRDGFAPTEFRTDDGQLSYKTPSREITLQAEYIPDAGEEPPSSRVFYDSSGNVVPPIPGKVFQPLNGVQPEDTDGLEMVYDEQGNVIGFMVPVDDTTIPTSSVKNGWLVDANGNVVLDENGLPKPAISREATLYNELGKEIGLSGVSTENTNVQLIDASGKIIGKLFDENGNEVKIAGFKMRVVVDANGNQITEYTFFDENGNIIDPTKLRGQDQQPIQFSGFVGEAGTPFTFIDKDDNHIRVVYNEKGQQIDISGICHSKDVHDENGKAQSQTVFCDNERKGVFVKDFASRKVYDAKGHLIPQTQIYGNDGTPYVCGSLAGDDSICCYDKDGKPIDLGQHTRTALLQFCDKEGRLVERQVVFDSQGKIIGYLEVEPGVGPDGRPRVRFVEATEEELGKCRSRNPRRLVPTAKTEDMSKQRRGLEPKEPIMPLFIAKHPEPNGVYDLMEMRRVAFETARRRKSLMSDVKPLGQVELSMKIFKPKPVGASKPPFARRKGWMRASYS